MGNTYIENSLVLPVDLHNKKCSKSFWLDKTRVLDIGDTFTANNSRTYIVTSTQAFPLIVREI